MNRIFCLLTVLSLTALTSCANLSKNSVREGKYVVRNGVAQDKKWSENLDLKRISWTHELTLSFDLMMTSIPPQSSFNFWFSKYELDEMAKCGDFKVVLAYSLDTKMIPYSLLNEQLERSGYKKVELMEFKKNFMAHPDAEMSSLRVYQLYGICRSDKNDKPLILNFPGYPEKVIN